MLRSLQSHPFAVEAFFRRSLVLTYAVPSDVLMDLMDPGLELDTYDGWGFLAIAMVQTEDLRPRGFPHWLGRDFFLSGYRIFTRYQRPGQSSLRGLRIVRSDTDRAMMARLGNLFTRYHYRLAKVSVAATPERLEVKVQTPQNEADLELVADLTTIPAGLPSGSPFRSLDDARRYAGPLPFTFSYDADRNRMVIIKGVRTEWNPQSVRVEVSRATFLESPRFAKAEIRLANAFYLENVPYCWMPGVAETVP